MQKRSRNSATFYDEGQSEAGFLRRYKLEQTLGTGGFSTVKCAIDRRYGRRVAVKIIDKAQYDAEDGHLKSEIDLLCQVRHPNCIRLWEAYLTERTVFLVMELATGGELLERVSSCGHFTEAQAARVVHQLLCGVAYLHSHGIVHRDVKLENLLLAKEGSLEVKLADFGLCKDFSDHALSTMYVAPEVIAVADPKTAAKTYSPAVDVWSTGVVLFMLLSGYSPFDDELDEAAMFEKIVAGDCDTNDPVWLGISQDAQQLVGAMLTVDPRKRPTAAQALRHPWLLRHMGSSADSSPPPSPLHALRRPDTPPRPQPRPQPKLQQAGESGCAVMPSEQADAMHAAGWSVPSDLNGSTGNGAQAQESEKGSVHHGGTGVGGGESGQQRGVMRESSSDSDIACSIEAGPRRVSTGLSQAKAALQRLSLF